MIPNWIKGLVLLGLLILGFVLGRGSRRPDPELLRRLEAYEKKRPALEAARDSLNRLVAARSDTIRYLDGQISVLRQGARADNQVAVIAHAAADALKALRQAATDPQQRLALCEQEVVVREKEATACEAGRAKLEAALSKADDATFARDRTITDLTKGRTEDSTRIRELEDLNNDAKRAVRGCRVPYVGFKCPAGTVSWDLHDWTVLPRYVSVTYPLREWLHVGVTWDRVRRAP